MLRTELDQVIRDVLLNGVVSSKALPRRLRTPVLRWSGHDIHRTAQINAGLFLGDWRGLTVEEGGFINYGCFIDLGAPVRMGKYSGIGYQTMLITCSHEVGPEWRRFGEFVNAPIDIGDGAWVGSRVTVMPGVTIGPGAVIASGSVVTRDCKPNGLYAGVPATFKRPVESDDKAWR